MLVGAATVFAVLVGYWSTRPVPLAPADPDLATALLEAGQVGNRIASSRGLADGGTEGGVPWSPERPWAPDTIFANLPVPPYTTVVYVHGFNTSLTQAVRSGNFLARALRSTIPAGAGGLAFYTFTWRGDFGPARFSESEKSAYRSGAALADFLQTVLNSRSTPAPRIVVLTHSLGARLALVAVDQLWRRAPRLWFDDLVMVQPAIPVGDLYVGEVVMTVGEQGVYSVSHSSHRGTYVEALGAANRVLVTTSARDEVLNTVYFLRFNPPTPGYGSNPLLSAALGTVGLGRSQTPSHYQEMPLDRGDLPAASLGHSGLLASPDLMRLLWARVALPSPRS